MPSKPQYAAKIVGVSPLRRIKRGDTELVRIDIRNVGQRDWYDLGAKASLPKGERQVQLMVENEDELLDFIVRWGRDETRTDRKFAKVLNRLGSTARAKRVVKSGQTAVFYALVTARKFATQGGHDLYLKLIFSDTGKAVPARNRRAIDLYVPAQDSPLKHWRRGRRITRAQPGKVHSVVENAAYKKLGPKAAKREAAVVMASWRRVEYLPKTIAHLLKQQNVKPVLHVWNNNAAERERINRTIKGKNLPIQVYHSADNIGGFGRFYLARELVDRYDRVIFIDDDQMPAPDVIATLYDEYGTHTIRSRWAYKFPDTVNYWHKRPIEPGEQAKYVGTCGMITPTSIFKDDRTFQCPARFWFIEDLWLSFVADHFLKWRLDMSKVELPALVDGRDQMTGLIDHKTRMLQYLVKRYNWKL